MYNSSLLDHPPTLETAFTAQSIDLRELVSHDDAVSVSTPLEDVSQQMRRTENDYIAVLEGRIPVGLCSRSQIGFIMGSRFGFALNSKLPVSYAMTTDFLVHHRGEPLMSLLQQALSRVGDAFVDDIVLVDEFGAYIGLVPVDRLARLQTVLLAQQLEQQESQQKALRETNVELFRHVNELRQTEARYQSVFENTTVGFALLNPDGSFETANSRLLRLLGLTGTVPPTNRFEDFVSESQRFAFESVLEEVRATRKPFRVIELNLQIPSRGERVARISVAWVPEIAQWSVSLDDVTDERALQVSAHEREKRSLLESLVGGVAHELNNKLTPIIGFSSLLSDDVGLDRIEDYGKLIGRSAQEAARIIQQLLHLSKPVQPQKEMCALQTLVQDTLTILKFKIRDAGVEPVCDLPVEQLDLFADPGQLKQVLMNLCVNAIDAMAERPIKRLVVSGGLENGWIVVRVRDTGVGIPPENLTRIFHPFFTTKGPQSGTGLGLSICSSVVEQHGGRIEVQSKMAQGSEFSVFIPVGDGEAVANTAGLIVGRPQIKPSFTGKVLVVEDEDVIAHLVQEILRREFDCVLERASTGKEALERCRDGDVSLILCDLRMPEMNGMEFFECLLAQQSRLTERFVFMSGNEATPEFRHKLAGFARPILRKPFSLSELVEAVRPFTATR